MEQSLLYVREIISAHTESSPLGKSLYEKLANKSYHTEEAFIRDLSEDESEYLNQVLKEAIDYSKQSQDDERANQLNDVYAMLFV